MVRKEDEEDARGRLADSSNVELLTNESFKIHFTRKLIKNSFKTKPRAKQRFITHSAFI